jgi:hypothetical protein
MSMQNYMVVWKGVPQRAGKVSPLLAGAPKPGCLLYSPPRTGQATALNTCLNAIWYTDVILVRFIYSSSIVMAH